VRPAEFNFQCKAKCKRSGVRCKNYRCRGRETCRMHGGTSRRGAEHHNFKHGKHSKVLAEVRRKFVRWLQRPIEFNVLLFPKALEEITAQDFRRSRQRGLGLRGMAVGLDQLTDSDRMRVIRAARRILAEELAELRAEAADNL